VASEIEAARELAGYRNRQTIRWGVLTGVAIACFTPFLQGFFLHKYAESFGKYFLLVSLLCFTVFMWSVGMTIWLWWYVRTLEREQRAKKRTSTI